MSSKAKQQRHGGGQAFHSRLEPFVDFIREQRQQRKTWQEIAVALSGEKNCVITTQGLHQFYRRYLRRRAKGHWETKPEIIDSVVPKPAHPEKSASRSQLRPAPLPPASTFKRPNLSIINTEEFT